MAKDMTNFEELMKTLSDVSNDPNAVSVGDFAKAVQSLQAELRMLESEIARLGGACDAAFGVTDGDGEERDPAHVEVASASPRTSDIVAAELSRG